MSKLLLDRRALLVTGISAVTLGACSDVIGPPAAAPMYLLRPQFPPATHGPRVNWQVSVTLPSAPESLDTDRIALVQPGNVMDYYANAQWSDRLPFLVQNALVDAFEADNRITAVGRDSDVLRSDYLLQTDIRDFEARYDVPDGIPTAVIRISAKLIAAKGRTIAQITMAHAEVPASANSVPAAAAAFNEALSSVIGQIVTWALTAPLPPRVAT
ncbi:MAG: ABC-type transport auxiliary lipoprotein family protein [Rhizomicrobium sp.]